MALLLAPSLTANLKTVQLDEPSIALESLLKSLATHPLFLTNPTTTAIAIGATLGVMVMLAMGYFTVNQFFGPNGIVTNATDENDQANQIALYILPANTIQKYDILSKYGIQEKVKTDSADYSQKTVPLVKKKPSSTISLTSNADLYRLLTNIRHFYQSHYLKYLLSQEIKPIRDNLKKIFKNSRTG